MNVTNVTNDKKEVIWQYMINLPKSYKPYGCTDKRLEKVKSFIFADEFLWDDVYWRHGLDHTTLEELVKSDKETYDHCVGNFWGMTMTIMHQKGMIK